MRIGDRNTEAVVAKLKAFYSAKGPNETGGSVGRTIEFYSDDGKLLIKTAGSAIKGALMDYKDLWQAYKEGGDTAAKDELIINYVPLVKSIAGRLFLSYNSQVEYDDTVGYGIIGIIDAIEKFDHKKEIKFETYASIRIEAQLSTTCMSTTGSLEACALSIESLKR